MRFATVPLLLTLLTVATFSAYAEQNDPGAQMDGVIQFTEANFDAEVGKDRAALVEFYAPWCGHCKSMAGEYAKLGAAVEANKAARSKIVIGKVDATEQNALGKRFDVNGFPTILFFPAGSQTPEKYHGGRTAEDFIKFLNGKVDGAKLAVARELQFAEEITNANFETVVLDRSKDSFVMFHAPWCGHCKALKPVFNKLAKVYENDKDELVIGMLNADEAENKPLASQYSVKSFPTLLFFPKNGKTAKPIEYNGARTLEDLIIFVNNNANKKRLADGDLSWDFGVDKTLTAAAVKLANEIGGSGAEKVIKDAEAQLAKIAKEAAVSTEYYKKVFDRIAADGEEYLQKELSRLKRMLDGSVAGKVRDDMLIRMNILSSIVKDL